MGRWRIENGLYGEQERWIPDFRGEWPVVPEPPCPVCSGELVRRTTYPMAGLLMLHWRRLMVLHAAAEKAGQNPGLVPPVPEPEPYTHYMRLCYRGPHGYSRNGSGEVPRGPGQPQTVGRILELAPPKKTRDWED
jgi:hypothetical protein